MPACPQCSEENPERAKFCLDCGAALAHAGAGAGNLYTETAARWEQFGNLPERETHALLGQGRCLHALDRAGTEVPLAEALELFASLGYSSLSYLQRFPVTSIKVDRSFVADLSAGRKFGIVQSILSIGDSFGLTTVAEGVEKPEQLELLAHLGCDRAQGYLLGRPLWPGEIDGALEIKRMAVARAGSRGLGNGSDPVPAVA